MAFLQPQNIPSRNDLPDRVQVVAKLLRDLLPDDVTVWLERTGDGDAAALRREFDPAGTAASGGDFEPYLVLLDPEAGIAVLEAPTVTRTRRHLLRNRRLEAEPLRQAIGQRAMELRRGLNAGQARALPVVHVLALPGARREDLPSEESLRVLTEEDFSAESLRPALHRIMGSWMRPLSAQEETGVRATIKPDIVIGGPSQSDSAKQIPMFGPPDDAAQIRALDRRQERLARHLGGGYRLIRGVAGSGKTLILVHRAKHFGQHFPDWRMLLLCFNRVLARALAQEVKGLSNVEARTVDSLAREILKATGQPVPDIRRGHEDEDFARRRCLALDAAGSLDNSRRFDMVLVDEAQDLGPSGLDLAWAMLKDDRDHFLIALDSAQNLYRRRMAWNPPDTTARGRATVLTVNYRNTHEILTLARGALQGLGASASDDPQSDHLDVLIEPEAALRRGPLPATYACADLKAEARAVAERIRWLIDKGAEAEQIVVLSDSWTLRQAVLATVSEAVDVKQLKNEGIAAQGKVRVANLYWPKGLEFRHVIVGGANHVRVPGDEERAQDEQRRRLLYVGMTRATETLTVTFSGEGIMDSIQRLPPWNPQL